MLAPSILYYIFIKYNQTGSFLMNLARLLAVCLALAPVLAAATPLPQIDISPKTQRNDVFPRPPVPFAAGVTARCCWISINPGPSRVPPIRW